MNVSAELRAKIESRLVAGVCQQLNGWLRPTTGTTNRWERFDPHTNSWLPDDGRRRVLVHQMLQTQLTGGADPVVDTVIAQTGVLWRLDAFIRQLRPLLTSSGPQSQPPGEPPAPQG